MEASLTVAICTYNRADSLRKTLASLSQDEQLLSPGEELLVINNNCCDHTSEVIDEFSGRLPIREIFETRQGLAAARNTALREFKTDWLIFTDDDVTVPVGTLNEYRVGIKQRNECAFFGGRINVDWSGRRPDWLGDESLPLVAGLIGHYAPPTNTKYSSSSLLPYGANFAVSRVLIDGVGSFNEKLGVRGNELGRGEETEYLLRALQCGYAGSYLEKAVILHRFDAERLSVSHALRYGIQKGLSIIGDRKQQIRPSRVKAYFSGIMFFLRGAVQLVRGRRDRFLQCVINSGIVIGESRREL